MFGEITMKIIAFSLDVSQFPMVFPENLRFPQMFSMGKSHPGGFITQVTFEVLEWQELMKVEVESQDAIVVKDRTLLDRRSGAER